MIRTFCYEYYERVKHIVEVSIEIDPLAVLDPDAVENYVRRWTIDPEDASYFDNVDQYEIECDDYVPFHDQEETFLGTTPQDELDAAGVVVKLLPDDELVYRLEAAAQDGVQ